MKADASRHQNPALIRQTFASIAARYDLANRALSLGVDCVWRARVARMVKSWHPQRVLDLATGSGDLAISIRKARPEALVVGADFCQPMMLEAQRKGFTTLVNADGTQLPFRDGAFDVVTVAFGLRNMASWETAVAEMARVLRRDGHVLILDFSLPSASPLCALYRLYLHRVLPQLAGAMTGNRGAYEYLGESIERFPRGQPMCRLIESCGFTRARAIPLSLGIVSIYTAVR